MNDVVVLTVNKVKSRQNLGHKVTDFNFRNALEPNWCSLFSSHFASKTNKILQAILGAQLH